MGLRVEKSAPVATSRPNQDSVPRFEQDFSAKWDSYGRLKGLGPTHRGLFQHVRMARRVTADG